MFKLDRFVVSVIGAASLLSMLWACVTVPNIDGTSVPTIGSEASVPSCEDVCTRLDRLCGTGPTDCVGQCADGGYDDEHRACAGQAESCQAALNDCVNAEEPTEEEAEAPPEADAGAEDAPQE